MGDSKRICLWSGPRNISTTLMYSFAQRKDTKVFDEPLYAHYLSLTNASDYHPGTDEILASMETSGEKVIDMMMGQHEKPVVFFKNMAHHLLDLDLSFMKSTINVLLTRDPVDMLPSFHKVIPNPKLSDVGYKAHVDLLEKLEGLGAKTIVLESKNILMNPKGVLTQLCDKCEIPFDESMLHWTAGSIPEDGVWAKYWYDNVHRSTGYMAYSHKTESFPHELDPLLKECMPYYEKLKPIALK